MPRDVCLSDSKCWNGGHEWVNAKIYKKNSEVFFQKNKLLKTPLLLTGGTRGADCALLAVNGRPFPLPAPLAGPALLHHGPSSSSVQDVTELLAEQKQVCK